MRAEITIYEDDEKPKTYTLEVSSIYTHTDKELGISITDYYYKFVYSKTRMGEIREC